MEHSLELNWIIKAQSLNFQHGQFLKTELIQTTLPNLEYQIYFYPNGKNQANAPEILFSVKTDSSVEIKATIATPSAPNTQFNLDATITKFDKNLLWGAPLVLPMNAKLLSEVVNSSKLTLQFRGTLKKQLVKRKCPFSDNPLREILWNNSGKDFTLVVGLKEIKVHKFLIAARSPYFQAMINSPWIENQENKTNIQEYPFEVVEKAIKFLYDFPLTFASKDDALMLFKFGEYYDIADLKSEAENYLITQINANTVCDLANTSMKCNAENLRLLCLNFLLKCQKTSFPIHGIESLNPEFNNELTKRIFCIFQNS